MTAIQEHPVAPPRNPQVGYKHMENDPSIQRQVFEALEPDQLKVVMHAIHNHR